MYLVRDPGVTGSMGTKCDENLFPASTGKNPPSAVWFVTGAVRFEHQLTGRPKTGTDNQVWQKLAHPMRGI